MSDLRAHLTRHTLPFLECLNQCSQEDAWNRLECWQTFTDGTKPQPDPLAKHWSRSIDDAAPDLERLNLAGAGVFVTVNQTNGRGRSKEHIVPFRGWHADLDTKDATEPFDVTCLPLAPTMIVRTPGGWHLYWLAHEPMPCDGKARREAHEAELKAIQATLARFGADKNTCDVSRVLRVPGFLHRKGEPRLVELVSANGPRYTREQVRAAFPAVAVKPRGQASDGAAGAPSRAEVLERAGQYLDKLPEAIQGQEGSETTFKAALKLMDGFALAEEEALSLLCDRYNPRCKPEWSEAELKHKVADAAKHCQDRGHLLRSSGSLSGDPGPSDDDAPPHLATAIHAIPATAAEWPDPQPLTSKLLPLPYPLEALPPVMRAAVEEVRGFVQAPVPLVASSALGALSLAAQAHGDVQRAEGLTGPVGVFLLTIADSGERKSTCDGFFTKPIREYEVRKLEEAKPMLQDCQAALEGWEAKRSGTKDLIRAQAKVGEDTREAERVLRELEHKKPEAPRVPRLIYGDATPESLKWNLAKSWPSGGVVSSEAGLVFGSHGMGSDSVMRNLSTLNLLWDGQAIQTERRTSECFTVRGARLTIGLQTQEATLLSFFGKSGELARGCGFLARFLVAWPESTQGTRAFTEAPAAWPKLGALNSRIGEILEQEVSIDPAGALALPMLALSVDAKAAWVAFHDRIESELVSGGALYDVRDVASKIADNAARIAALFHLLIGGGGAIGADTLKAACTVAEWHLNEARRFFGELALPPGLVNAARLEDWLVKRCRQTGAERIPTQDVLRLGPGCLRDKAAIDAAMVELEELGRAQRLHEGRRKYLALNPKIIQPGGFATARPAILASPGTSLPPDGSENRRNRNSSSSKPPAPGDSPVILPLVSGADWDSSIPVEV